MKPWYESKTMWFNGLVAAIGSMLVAFPAAAANFPPSWMGWFLLLNAAVSGFLRAISTEELTK